jgi:hypothetical protein
VRSLRKAFALPVAEWFLVLRAALWFARVEVGLGVFPFSTLIGMLQNENLSHRTLGSHSYGIERVAYCVELASRFDPLPVTCLKKALVLYALLTRKGIDARLFIGAAKNESRSRVVYHAWIEHQGQVILGGDTRECYVPLYCLNCSHTSCAQGQPAR